jgi:hypothetical protein
MHPEHRSIGELAYSLWQSRGCPDGSAEQDWLDAEKQLKAAQRATDLRTTEPRAAEPPANADAKWKAPAPRKGTAAARPRQSKSTQSKPSAKPPG